MPAILEYALEKQEGLPPPYTTNTDGGIVLGSQAWRGLHSGIDLGVGQAILITLWNTDKHNLDMMMVINYIQIGFISSLYYIRFLEIK